MKCPPKCPHICGDRNQPTEPMRKVTLSPLSPLIYLHAKYIHRYSWYVLCVVMYIIGNGDKLLAAKDWLCRLISVPIPVGTGFPQSALNRWWQRLYLVPTGMGTRGDSGDKIEMAKMLYITQHYGRI